MSRYWVIDLACCIPCAVHRHTLRHTRWMVTGVNTTPEITCDTTVPFRPDPFSLPNPCHNYWYFISIEDLVTAIQRNSCEDRVRREEPKQLLRLPNLDATFVVEFKCMDCHSPYFCFAH